MLNISPIPAFTDNYIWAIYNQNHCIIVDPGSSDEVLAFLQLHQLELCAILITHWHHDHTGGIQALTHDKTIPVFGPNNSNISGITHEVTHETSFSLLNTDIQVLATPCHTLDHISFYLPNESALFCGDTLFSAGCGRLFEGDAAMMYHSLSLIKQLPISTRIFCTHEYTISNLRFALELEPYNSDIQQRLMDCEQMRKQNLATLPSTLAIELCTNPFLRTDDSDVITQALNQGAVSTNPLAIFTTLREWKDHF